MKWVWIGRWRRTAKLPSLVTSSVDTRCACPSSRPQIGGCRCHAEIMHLSSNALLPTFFAPYVCVYANNPILFRKCGSQPTKQPNDQRRQYLCMTLGAKVGWRGAVSSCKASREGVFLSDPCDNPTGCDTLFLRKKWTPVIEISETFGDSVHSELRCIVNSVETAEECRWLCIASEFKLFDLYFQGHRDLWSAHLPHTSSGCPSVLKVNRNVLGNKLIRIHEKGKRDTFRDLCSLQESAQSICAFVLSSCRSLGTRVCRLYHCWLIHFTPQVFQCVDWEGNCFDRYSRRLCLEESSRGIYTTIMTQERTATATAPPVPFSFLITTWPHSFVFCLLLCPNSFRF